MEIKKKVTIFANGILLIWFFFDMVGVVINNRILVSKSWKDDGIFFVIFALAFLWFALKDKIGKYILSGWLFMWFATQFYSHWVFTIFGPWEGKIEYFNETIKLIASSKIYIPDLYHIILHILILFALVSTLIYCFQSKNPPRRYA